MERSLKEDISTAAKKLCEYVDKGKVGDSAVEMEKPEYIAYSPALKIPLKSVESYSGNFVAVDCSTKPLMKANRWGVYLLRVAYASVNPSKKENKVTWGPTPPKDRIVIAVGNMFSRMRQLERFRFEYESEIAINLLERLDSALDYLTLDGASYFGDPEDRRFALSLYEEANKRGLALLTISKRSEIILDPKGRDFISKVAMDISTAKTWAYPIEEMRADSHKNRYGDVHLIKLSPRTLMVFRCDIMNYLGAVDLVELLSPLTCISDDARCIGYPVSLYLAHNFSQVKSTAKLLWYHDKMEETIVEIASKDVLNRLRMEEAISNFRGQLRGIKHPWESDEVV